jgi:hypothetical protein
MLAHGDSFEGSPGPPGKLHPELANHPDGRIRGVRYHDALGDIFHEGVEGVLVFLENSLLLLQLGYPLTQLLQLGDELPFGLASVHHGNLFEDGREIV